MSKYREQYRSPYVVDNETGESLINTHPRYIDWLAVPGNVPDPADPPPVVIRYLTKRTIATRLKAMGLYEAAFGVVTAAGKLQDWNDAMDIQAEPPDPEVLAAFQMAGMTQEQINEVLRA